MEVFNFKLLEMSQQDTDQETRERDDGTWIKIKFEDMEKLPTQKISWKEKMTFDLKLPVDKQKRPFIYFSQDLKKMMISPPGDPHPVIYECLQLEIDQKVDWKPIKRITRFPTMLQGLCSSNCLFTPNFEFFIDFDFTENQFVIKETMKEEIIKLIPSGMIKLTLPGKDKSPMQIPVVGSRIMFYSYDEIRILGNDSLDVILKLDYSDQSESGLNISSFVAVDNYNPDSFVDRHAFVEKADIPMHDTFNRLIRKSKEFKQIRVHTEIQIREQELKEKKLIGEEKVKEILRDIAYQEIFSVNYLEKKQFSVDLSFTILDWLIIKQVLDGKNFHLNQIAPKRLIQMCFNIFPKLQSVLHLLANNFKSAQKQLKYVEKIFKDASSGKYSDLVQLTLPITQDEDLMTPLDICLQENSLNINMVDIILNEIKDYPLLHSSHLLQSVVCKAIQHNVPCIGEFLDARIIPSSRLESSEKMSSGAIKEELLNEVCGQNVGWGEFSILESTSSLRQKMFNEESGFQRHLSLSYFDIPSINDLSIKSNEFFQVLADTENIDLFKCRSINIIIEKAWAEHRTIFICFFAIPYIILLIAYYTWSNFTSLALDKSGFETEEGKMMAGKVCHAFIVFFASYFLIQEIYQLQADPKDYFSSMWNFLDIGTMLLVLVAPSNEIRNIFYCSRDKYKESCLDGIPEFQSKHTTILMWYVRAAASLALWMKLMYYVRMYKPTSYLVRAAIKVIGNLQTFMFIYLMAVFAFTDAFYTASVYHEKSYYDEEATYYGSWQQAFLATYQFMMAGSGELDNTQTPLVFVLFFLASIVIYLCLLNLLIASVGAVFAEVQETQDQYAMQERAQLISDVRSFPITQWFVKQREPETFLFIASYKNWHGPQIHGVQIVEKNKEQTH